MRALRSRASSIRSAVVADARSRFKPRYRGLALSAIGLGGSLAGLSLAVLRAPFVLLVSGALLRFEGQLSTFRAFVPGENPCFRCLFPEPPPEGTVPRCDQAGIFGAVAGALGTLQAAEVLKEILGLGETMSGRLLLYDALSTNFRKIKAKRDPACALCGPQATIRDLSLHVR